MKTKILKTIVAMLIIAACFSCEEDELETISLPGTSWELAGTVNAKTGKLRELNSNGRPHTFYFDSDSAASEVNINVHRAYLVLFPETYIYVYPYTYMLIADEFYDVIYEVDAHKFKGNELRLFYNGGKNYLLYKLQP
ncbi:MAG: hypothetical protein LBJ57_04025 [Prevotellaceae bacterium]|jgi:hypothetical protein|nr:hypothetical protein [Prevotellaceae bacterium]